MIRPGYIAVFGVAYTWSASAGRSDAVRVLPTAILPEQK
jgi:hypothetical protein